MLDALPLQREAHHLECAQLAAQLDAGRLTFIDSRDVDTSGRAADVDGRPSDVDGRASDMDGRAVNADDRRAVKMDGEASSGLGGRASDANGRAACLDGQASDVYDRGSAVDYPPCPQALGLIPVGSASVELMQAELAAPTCIQPLWKLATELGPAEYACKALVDFVHVPTSVSPTDEGLRCVICMHYILLDKGVSFDGFGEACCAHCAAHRLLVKGEEASTAAGNGAREEEAPSTAHAHVAVHADLQSARCHVERLARCDVIRGQQLWASAAEEGLGVEDVAARGVLCAYAEAEALCERMATSSDGASCASAVAGQVADAMIRTWEAQVPSSLLVVLASTRPPPGGHAAAGEMGSQRSASLLCHELRRARLRCAELYLAHGLRLGLENRSV